MGWETGIIFIIVLLFGMLGGISGWNIGFVGRRIGFKG